MMNNAAAMRAAGDATNTVLLLQEHMLFLKATASRYIHTEDGIMLTLVVHLVLL